VAFSNQSDWLALPYGEGDPDKGKIGNSVEEIWCNKSAIQGMTSIVLGTVYLRR
jgi:hypothetical protein